MLAFEGAAGKFTRRGLAREADFAARTWPRCFNSSSWTQRQTATVGVQYTLCVRTQYVGEQKREGTESERGGWMGIEGKIWARQISWTLSAAAGERVERKSVHCGSHEMGKAGDVLGV